jgi:hypothetical protein
VAQYVNVMSKDGEWGGHLELQALSELLACTVVVHKKSLEEYYVTPMNPSPHPTIFHLAFFQDEDFEHYLSIREINDDSEDPAVDRLKNLNNVMYHHLLELSDPEEMALRRQIEELSLDQVGWEKAEEGEEENEERKKPKEPYPGLGGNKKCRCGSNTVYKNCCLKKFYKRMA